MKLKKVILWSGVGFMILVLVLLPLPFIFINPIIVSGVEKAGPLVAQVETKLESANVSLFSGNGTLKGLHIGNPPGYKSASAVRAGEISIGVKPSSLLADKVVVTHIRLIDPEITFEGGPKENNFSKILANLKSFTGGSSSGTNQAAPAGGPAKKLQVDKVVISGAKVNALTPFAGGQPLTLTLPDIEINGLGQGPEGITTADLTAAIIKEISGKTMNAVMLEATKRGTAIANQAVDAAGAAAQQKLNQSLDNKVPKGIGDLLKKK